MKKILFIILFLFLNISSNGEIIHTVASGPGYSYNLEIYIPNNTTGALPAVIFIPGNGEVGTDRNKLYTNGPLKYIRDNAWSPNFIVIGAQPSSTWPNEIFVQRVLLEVFKPIYHINQSRWYLTGLSAGANAIFVYITNSNTSSFIPPMAIVPFSITTWAQCGDVNIGTDYLCGTDLRYSSIPAWGFAGSSDSHHDKMRIFFNRLIEAGYTARWTSYAGGHCCWNNFYDPNYRENQKNIYEWMFQYPTIILSVEFKYFTHQNGYLNWATEQESNSSHFEIEESTDGENWTKIGEVPSKSIDGNSSIELSYQFRI